MKDLVFKRSDGQMFTCIDVFMNYGTRFYLMVGTDWKIKVIKLSELEDHYTVFREIDQSQL